MNALIKMTWIELKLFAREPLTMIFTFFLPILMLFVMGGVFGNTPSEGAFRGVGGMNYYTPAYIGLVLAALGLISVPVHLTSYREKGILRRLRASSISLWALLGSQIIVMLVLAVVCTILLVFPAVWIYDVHLPKMTLIFVGAFAVSTLCFAAIGILLGSLFTTTRATQGIGTLLFFAMMLISGSGPPQDVMSAGMQTFGKTTPLWHMIILLQDPWFGYGWNLGKSIIVSGFMVCAVGLAYRFFKWK